MNTILLVEDNPHIMKINSTSLMMEGYHILQATTAAYCLQTLRSNDVDLIILDITCPSPMTSMCSSRAWRRGCARPTGKSAFSGSEI